MASLPPTGFAKSTAFICFRLIFKVGFGNDAAAPKVEVVTPASDGRGDAKSTGALANGHVPAVTASAVADEEDDDDIDIDDI